MQKYIKKGKELFLALLAALIVVTSINTTGMSLFAAEKASEQIRIENEESSGENAELVENAPDEEVEKPEGVVDETNDDTQTQISTENLEKDLLDEVKNSELYIESLLEEGFEEDESLRTIESKTFVKGQESETLLFMSPIHFEEEGKFKDYELDIEPTIDVNTRSFNNKNGYTVKQSDTELYIPKDINAKNPVEIQMNNGVLSFIQEDQSFSHPNVEENIVRFDENNTSFIALDAGVKQSTTYESIPTTISYLFTIPEGYHSELDKTKATVQFINNETNNAEAFFDMPSYYVDGQLKEKYGDFFKLDQINENTVRISADATGDVPPFTINLDATVYTSAKGNLSIYGMNAAAPHDTYGYNKSGSSHKEMVMIGYVGAGHGMYYSPVGFYSAVSKFNGNFKTIIGANREVTEAKYHLLEFTSSTAQYPTTGTDFTIARLEKDLGDVSNITQSHFNNVAPSRVVNDSIRISKTHNTFANFNIKEAVTAWYSGAPNYGFNFISNRDDEGLIFANEHPENAHLTEFGGLDGRPYITIKHQKAEPIPDDYDINKTTVNLRPFTSWSQEGALHFQALGFDGIARPGTQVDIEVYEKKTGEKVFENVADSSNGFRKYPYYEPPLYPKIPETQSYYGLSSNWQAFDRLPTSKLKKNVEYGVKVRAKKVETNGTVTETGKWVEGDTFQLYKATNFDNLYRVMNFYGVPKDKKVLLMQDNHMGDEMVVKDNELFIRNPKKNQNKGYKSPELSEQDKKNIDYALIGRGKHCEFGYEPINLNTGNFYYTNEDASWFDFDEMYTFTRSYNSMADETESIFGRQWNFTWDKHLYFRKNEDNGKLDVFYEDGTGKKLVFTAKADGTYESPWGEHMSLERKKIGDKEVLVDNDYYDIVDEKPKTKKELIGIYQYELKTQENETLTFDVDGYLTKAILNQNNHEMKFTYNEMRDLEKITTASGKEFKFTYNADNYVSKITQPDGSILEYKYDSNGNLTHFIDSLGAELTYTYEDANKPYLMTSYLDRENGQAIIKNTYDDKGRVASQLDAKGDTVTFTYNTDHTEITSFNGEKEYVYFDDMYRTTKYIGKDGVEKNYTYDANNNLLTSEEGATPKTTYTYNNDGYILTEARADGKVKTYEYDANNLPTVVTNFDGTITTFTYDGNRNLTGAFYPDGSSVETTYNDKGQKLTEKDRNGNVIINSYDAKGNLISILDGHGTKTKTYDAYSRILTETDSLGNTVEYIKNKRGELIEERKPNGSYKYAYDKDGQKIYEEDPNGNAKTFKYDDWSRLIEESDSYGTKSFTYDAHGNKLTETDELGNTTSYQYDDGGRVTKTTFPNGSFETSEYNAKGLLVKSTDKLGLETTYEYDQVMGYKLADIDVQGRRTEYEYDVFGNVIKTIHPDGLVEENIYDVNNLLVKQIDKRGNITKYTYDANGNEIETNINDNKITSKVLGLDDIELETIDELGNKTTKEYNAAKLPIKSTLANGTTLEYTYDGQYNLIETKDSAGFVELTTYDANGNVLTETDKNGNTKSFTYTVRNQVATETHADGGIIQHVYDAKGQEIETIDELGNSTKQVYDEMGQVVETIDSLGNITKSVYNLEGQLIEEIDKAGNKTITIYDKFGRKVETKAPTGIITTTVYDEFDRVVEEKDNFNHITTTVYDELGDVIETINERGNKTETFYDAYGREIETIDERGNSSYKYYDAKDQVIKEIDDLGNIVEIEFNGISQEARKVETTDSHVKVTSKEFDPLTGLLSKLIEDGKETTFTYDKNGNVTSLTNPLGHTTTYEYDSMDREINVTDGAGRSKQTVYDLKGQVVSEIDGRGNSKDKVYDALGQVVEEIDELGYKVRAQYNELGQVVRQEDKHGNVVKQAYDIFGNVTLKDYGFGIKAEYIYDEQGREIKRIGEACNDCGQPGIWFETEYNEFDEVVTSRHPNGLEESFTYDKFGNTLEKTNNLGEVLEVNVYDIYGRNVKTTNAIGEVTEVTYDSSNREVKKLYEDGLEELTTYNVDGKVETTTDIRGLVTTNVYDAVGNQVETHYPNGTIDRSVYDASGNIIESIDTKGNASFSKYDENNNHIEATDELGFVTSTTYTKRNEVETTTDANGNVLTTSYDANGNKTSEVDSLGNEQSYGYDEHNRLTVIKDRLGFETSYTYDKYNNLIAQRDARGNEVEIAFDEMNNEILRRNPDNTKEKKAYDLKGNLVKEVNGNRKEVKYEYDALNREVKKSFDDKEFTYEYNRVDQMEVANNKDKETEIKYTPTFQVENVKDELGRNTKYEYDEFGRRTAIVYPDGKRADYTYNEHHELVEVKSGNNITTYTYDARGQLTEMTAPNMDATTYTYDGNGNTTNLKTESQNQKIIAEFNSEFDGNDNKVVETSVVDGEKVETSYAYDANEQLIQSNKLSKFEPDSTNVEVPTRDEKTEYTYDGSGNKIAEISTINGKVKKKQFNFDKNNKLEDIKAEQGVKYTYDDMGNVTKKKHKNGLVEEYKYDATGQLLNITNNRGKELTYTYDAMGNRLTKDEVTNISKSSNSLFIKFQKDKEFNEEYSADLHIQTSVEQLTNLRRSIDEYSQHRDGYTCNWNDEDGPKESRKHFEYVNDLTTEYTEVLQIYSNNFKPFETFVYGNQRISREDRKGNTFLYQYDSKGSVIGQKNNTKSDELLYKISYNDFGMPNRELNNEYGYNAEAHDYNGTQYLRARYYDTKTGAFGQRDTFLGDKEEAQSLNRYTYVWNNPNKYTDPSGHAALHDGGGKPKPTPPRPTNGGGGGHPVLDSWGGSQKEQQAINHTNEINKIAAARGISYEDAYITYWGNKSSSSQRDYDERAKREAAAYRKQQEKEAKELERWAKKSGNQLIDRKHFETLEDYLFYLRKVKRICDELSNNKKVDSEKVKKQVEDNMAVPYSDYQQYSDAYARGDMTWEQLVEAIILVMFLWDVIEILAFLGSMGVLQVDLSFDKAFSYVNSLDKDKDGQVDVFQHGGKYVIEGPEYKPGSRGYEYPTKSRGQLTTQEQDMYSKYEKNGWRGNVSGQTEGTNAGRRYENREKADSMLLPKLDANGNTITYKEFDINNKIPGEWRDGYRFVKGSDGKVYYTDDHYRSFSIIK